MQLRESINKTKTFFRRNLTTLKRFLHSQGYHKLPKPSSLHSFLSCGRSFHEIKEIFSHQEWQLKKKEPHRGNEEEEGDECQPPETEQQPSRISLDSKEATFFSFNGEEEEEEKVKNPKVGVPRKPSTKEVNLGLARKMKEMEMVDVLDVEEALHYYSRLTSPVYVGIVDRFFMDMYTDFPMTRLISRFPVQLSNMTRVGSSMW